MFRRYNLSSSDPYSGSNLNRRNWLIVSGTILLIVILSAFSAIVSYHGSTTSVNSNSTSQSLYEPSFLFNEARALEFYQKLVVNSSGLLQTFPGSYVIYLADDQALDCYALQQIFNSTGNSLASSEAQGIISSMSSWGGLYNYWNPIFVTVGDYSESWVWSNGVDQQISSTVSDGKNYTIMATVFSPNPNFDYYNYSDQEFYYALWSLHAGNYTSAETAFEAANHFWKGYGFADQAFSASNGIYTSYKLALDLIVWKSLESNLNTANFATSYVPEMKNVTSIMSGLQGADGGVLTNYAVSRGVVVANASISLENGETTSLFTLANNLK
ncbi:MAG: hypothetical protein ACYCPW_03830 [Nitrososphaerales archaeon]